MEFLFKVLAWVGVAILFSLAVFIHEFGHFLAARWLGLQVDAFSIGFGPAIWKKRSKGVEYRIGCVPFGGYVALPQLDPAGMDKVQGKQENEKEREKDGGEPLQDIAAWRRIVVACAGPFGNVALAVVLALFIWAVPGAHTGVTDTRIGFVEEDGSSWKAGLRPGDCVTEVNGKAVKTWTDLQTECVLAGSENKAVVSVLRGTERLAMTLPLSTNNLFETSMLDDVAPFGLCIVERLVKDSPAAAAGLKEGDTVLAVNRKAVLSAASFIKLMGAAKGSPVELTVRRGKEQMKFAMTPQYSKEAERFLIGVLVGDSSSAVKPWMMYKDPWGQLKWDSLSVVRVLHGLVRPAHHGERMAIAKSLGGPVLIFSMFYNTVRTSVWDSLGLLRMICINLAILNILPIPVLDGGHVIFGLYEIITRRKPHPKVVAALVNTFAVLLLGLMAVLVYRDIVRQVKIVHAEHEAEAGAGK
jgi:regulator of sigma E protease